MDNPISIIDTNLYLLPHQWPSGSELKAGRQEVPGWIPGHACRPSRSEFSLVFLQNSPKYELGSLRKTLTEGTPLVCSDPTSRQLILILQQNPIHLRKLFIEKQILHLKKKLKLNLVVGWVRFNTAL